MKTPIHPTLILLSGLLTFSFSNQTRASEDACKKADIADLDSRDPLPQTEISKNDWTTCCGSWGPWPNLYPAFNPLPSCSSAEQLRNRLLLVAHRYIGLSYLHRHIPGMGGLDCSNFTSWVYNFGFGKKIDSNVKRQAENAGRRLSATEAFLPGDLLFIWNRDKSEIAHVAFFIDENSLIDSTDSGVQVRPFSGWYKKRFAWARRLIE